ncbi:hypothetical protein [Streptomyces sp. NBC_01294]|uniref:hypothetical protein n=1 Tax=Streptomyces sp. NBC_01294 TaxID=2903815 RepID=UPI002DDB4814|nr:hypothetical protein [Streptomyces sp. NBC_01294]WRZ62161.1 hypothetical protein OG534_01160 [Streptomyces sp. NBC_01294]
MAVLGVLAVLVLLVLLAVLTLLPVLAPVLTFFRVVGIGRSPCVRGRGRVEERRSRRPAARRAAHATDGGGTVRTAPAGGQPARRHLVLPGLTAGGNRGAGRA